MVSFLIFQSEQSRLIAWWKGGCARRTGGAASWRGSRAYHHWTLLKSKQPTVHSHRKKTKSLDLTLDLSLSQKKNKISGPQVEAEGAARRKAEARALEAEGRVQVLWLWCRAILIPAPIPKILMTLQSTPIRVHTQIHSFFNLTGWASVEVGSFVDRGLWSRSHSSSKRAGHGVSTHVENFDSRIVVAF